MREYTEQYAPRTVSAVRRYFPQVDRVADANKPLKIRVTEKHGESAKQMKHQACVLAKACEDVPEVDGAIIKTTTAFLIKGNMAIRYILPATVTREIVSFDRHNDFRPGEYQLSPMCKSHMLQNKRGGGNHTKPKGILTHRKKLIAKHRTEGIRGLTPHDGK